MKKGRNKELAEKRNNALFIRYFELSEEKKMRADAALKKLSEEFYISENRILSILRNMAINEYKTSGRDIIRERATKRGFSGFRGIRTSKYINTQAHE